MTRVPGLVSAAARRANREALAAHERGDYRESLAGFRRTLELSPDYTVVRFNAACALARLGRLDEARAGVRSLLCADLPSYAQRVLHDPDLETLRAGTDVPAFIAQVAERYEAAMREGVPLVAYREEPHSTGFGGPTWAQAGAWLHSRARFVPLGPAARMTGAAPIVASTVDVEGARVLSVTTPGSDAEGPAPVPVRVQIFRVPTGEPLGAGRVPRELSMLQAGFAGGEARVRGTDLDGAAFSFRVGAGGLERAPDAALGRHLVIGPLAWWLDPAPEPTGYGLAAGNGALTTPEGPIALSRGAHLQSSHSAWLSDSRDLAVVLSASWGDCGYPDHYLVDIIDLRTRRIARTIRGRGQVHVMLGHDGALYLQRSEELLRFADPRAPASETLPSGLGLSSRPDDVNPYC